MLGASPAHTGVPQKEPHETVGQFKDNFTFSLTCERVGMCRACLEIAAAIFGTWDDLWRSASISILVLHSWRVSCLNCDRVTILGKKNLPGSRLTKVRLFHRVKLESIFILGLIVV